MNSRKYKIITFGCKVNSYESQALAENLEKLNYSYDENFPDLIIVNTCAVTSVSEKKCLTKVRSLSNQHPKAQIIVVGCSSQLHSQDYLAISNVKIVAGNSCKSSVLSYLYNKEKINFVKSSLRQEFYDSNLCISRFEHHIRAFIKIQDGCDNFCSYCVIPLVRGNSRSRSHEAIIAEIKRLFQNDYKEIVITGIDMGSYQCPDDKNYRLEQLLNDIVEVTPPGCRIRVSSLEASQITDKIISLFANNSDKLVSHIHIPLQSGSPEILEKMNRKYDLEQFFDLTQKLKKLIPNIGLSTDVIVGFPGESRKLFDETYEFIRRVGFMRVHVFPYSPRPFTKAAKMGDQVSTAEKKERVHLLIELSDRLSKEFHEKMVGIQLPVLFESEYQKDGHNYYQGYTSNYLEVSLSADKSLIGQIIVVDVTEKGFRLNNIKI